MKYLRSALGGLVGLLALAARTVCCRGVVGDAEDSGVPCDKHLEQTGGRLAAGGSGVDPQPLAGRPVEIYRIKTSIRFERKTNNRTSET